MLSVKKNFQKLNMEDIVLTGENKVFIDHSLCPYYLVFRSKSKVLLSMGKINSLMVSNRTVKVKISEIRAPISITHVDDFTKYFPDNDLALSVYSLVKAFILSSWVILQNIEFFSFNFCYRVVVLLTFFKVLSQLLLSFFKDKLKKNNNQLSLYLEK